MAMPQTPQPPRDRSSCARPVNTTPDVASPRLSKSDPDALLPLRTRIEIIVSLGFTAWGFAMVAVAILKSL